MSTEKPAELNNEICAKDLKRTWIAPKLTKMRAGEAETGNVGMGGEANTQS